MIPEIGGTELGGNIKIDIVSSTALQDMFLNNTNPTLDGNDEPKNTPKAI